MTTRRYLFLLVVTSLPLAACGSVANKTEGTGGSVGSDGSVGTGGATVGAGGTTGLGGATTGSGGATGAGGATGSGGTIVVDAGPTDAPALVDGGVGDAPSGACDLTKPFSTPALVTSITTTSSEEDVWLTADSRTAIMASNRPSDAGVGDYDLYIASRSAAVGDFGVATLMANVNSPSSDRRPVLTSDGLTLFFTSNRTVGEGGTGNNIFVSTRVNTLADFGAPGTLANANTSSNDLVNSVTSDGKILYLDSTVGASRDLYMKDLTSSSPPVSVTELNSASSDEAFATISADSLTMYFASTRPLPGAAPDAGTTDYNVWTAHRSTPTGTFSDLAPVTELNSSTLDVPNWISPDGCTIYISTERDGIRHIWSATKPAS